MIDRFRRMKNVTRLTRDGFFGRLPAIFRRPALDDSLYEELEELLIQADVGLETTDSILSELRRQVGQQGVTSPAGARPILEEVLIELLSSPATSRESRIVPGRLNTVLVVGVNGTGKTTSIAKLAKLWRSQGLNVMLAAADTFRAAAIDQLKIWSERAGVYVVSHQPGADPGAVVYDALQAGQARGADVLIIDTAGRLHTKYNLMEELKKIGRVLSKWDPEAPHSVLMVIDATTGQNAVQQAKEFTSAVGVDGIVLAKLDGTARGGVVFAIVRELVLPVRYVGTGEGIDDIAEFDAAEFVRALLGAS